ncbi:MAG TPA: L-histidine N(alpha)-methyltransferase [Alphaproteobacteria bacterium]|nr:L-histidine N(alpha)-methyltransferase [Alphaproteobacteria bacterium]
MNNQTLLSPPPNQQSSRDGFLSETVAGLSKPQKTLPFKFFYDEEGSRLFNDICELEEYYVTRVENQILRDNIEEIATLIGSGCRLVEFGSGTSTKTRHLLTHLRRMSSYVPIDISGPQLVESAAQLSREFPNLEICPVEADYNDILELPGSRRKSKRTVAFFPGSTIGNLEPDEAVAFLGNIAFLCGGEGCLLIGIDRKKDRRILEPAYNDRKGVTARFNLNILARANRELGADFDLSAFRHHAPYNEIHGRIEMHLVSQCAQTVHLDSQDFRFEEGEHIITEYSYKYTLRGFERLALRAGFDLVEHWEDPDDLFSVLFLRVERRTNIFEEEIHPAPAALAA